MSQKIKALFVISLMLIATLPFGSATALSSNDQASANTLHSSYSLYKSLVNSRPDDYKSVITPLRHAQNNASQYRSKSEVVSQVKQSYNAKVLKISLNKKRAVYKVRVLMPNGKVKNVQINARR